MKHYKNYVPADGGKVGRPVKRSGKLQRGRRSRCFRGVLAVVLALAVSLALASGGQQTAAQSLSCGINQITFTTGGFNVTAQLSGDGTRLAFVSTSDLTGSNDDGNSEVFLYDTQTNIFTQVTDTTGDINTAPSLSGDGTCLAFVSTSNLMGGNPEGNREIFLYDVPTASLTQVTFTTGGAGTDTPSLSSDGTRLAFRSASNLTGGNSDGNIEVFLYDVPTATLTQVTFTTEVSNIRPALSGDGTRLAYESNSDLTDTIAEIFLYDVPTGSITQVTDMSGKSNIRASLSDDGTRLIFESTSNLTGSNDDGNREIFLYDVATASFTQVTDTSGGFNQVPTLSGDGMRLAFDSDRNLTGSNDDGNREIFLYDVATASFTQVTDTSGGFNGGPALSSDGTRFAFTSDRNLTGSNDDGNLEIFLATCMTDINNDDDNDGIPNDSDPDTVADVVNTLPVSNFNSAGNKNAFLSRLDAIEQMILAGDIDQAVQELQNLRRRVDGCGAAADTNDWITDCAAQLQVRALIDMLITNLSS